METKVYAATPENCIFAGNALKEGKLVAFPTDTVYGLGAPYGDREAVRKIFVAKGRDEGKPLSVLISDLEQVNELAAEVPEAGEILMERFWPGALTLILKKSDNIPPEVSAGKDTIGIRMPESETARMIISACGSPVAAPSANTSGKRSAACTEDVVEDLSGKIDIIIDAGSAGSGTSSTVLDLSRGKIEILRKGEISEDMILKALESSTH